MERPALTCVPTTRTVTGVRSGSSETRSVLPLATASTTAGNGLPLPADCSSASALNSAMAQGSSSVELTPLMQHTGARTGSSVDGCAMLLQSMTR